MTSTTQAQPARRATSPTDRAGALGFDNPFRTVYFDVTLLPAHARSEAAR
jgi:hypothetical protein